MKRFLFLSLVVASVASHAIAQDDPAPVKRITYTSQADRDQAKAKAQAGEEANRQAYYRYPVGKTYWLVPGKGRSVGFYKSLTNRVYDVTYDDMFTPDTTVAFVVTAIEQLPGNVERFADPYFYRVEIEDGTKALMKLSDFGTYEPGTSRFAPRMELSASPRDAKFGMPGIYTKDPEQLRVEYQEQQQREQLVERERVAAADAARQADEKATRARQARASREYQRKGGVRVGMSPKQARASNWGAPESINRTTGSYGIHEQWVYGDGNYLYFENGILTAIQN